MTDPVAALRTALSEHYVVERELGHGGMATVYLAHDRKHDRHVALKVLRPELAAALGRERFLREIKLAARLQHPNILPVYDSGAAGDLLYYVMPFVEGESLRDRLEREKQLSIEEALQITREVADALAYAHSHDVVHRDIKPENILLSGGHAIVADFGIARAISAAGGDKVTETGLAIGTPAYMSPEQASGSGEIDRRSDIYSLGCVTYEMLAGMPPFTGPTAQAVMARHSLDSVPRLKIVRELVPDAVEGAITRALAKVPADRFATAYEFAQALSASSVVTPVARTVSRGVPGVRPMPRVARGAVWAVVIVAMVGSGWTVWRLLGRPRPAAAAGDLDPRRVAVLYFADESRDSSLGNLADGLTEALIEELEQVRELDVISRNGVLSYRGGDVPRDSIARAVAAGTLVEGSVEQAGARLRVTVRLVDGASGADLRRQAFELAAADQLAIRDSLAQQAARFLRERLGEEIRLRDRREGTRSTEAWLLVQRAEKLRRESDDLARGGSTEAAATRLGGADSLLVLAEKADAAWPEPIVLRGHVAYRRGRLNAAPEYAKPLMLSAHDQAERALALSPRSPRALELRGTVRYQIVNRQLERRPSEVARLLKEAEQDLRAAVTAEPSLATAWHTLSDLYIHGADLVQGQLAARRAYEEDAYLSAAPRILWQLFSTAYELEDFVGADDWCQEGYRRFPKNPQFVRCQLFVLTADLKPADPATAWRLVDAWRALVPATTWELEGRVAHGLAAIVLARGGLADSATRVIEASRASGAIDPQRQLFQYEAYVRLLRGERDEALRLLQQYLAVNPGIRSGMTRRYSWWWRDLAKDPRFKAMIETGG